LAQSPSSKTASGKGVPRQPTWFTRRRLLLLALLVFIVGGIAAGLDIRFVGRNAPRVVPANSSVVLDARTMKTRSVRAESIPLPPPSKDGGGLLWSVDPDTNKLIGRAPLSKRVVRTVTVGTEPVALAIGFGSIWVANEGNDSITRVPLAGTRVETLGLNDQPSGIATGDGYVWVLSERSRKVLRIDPETNLVTKSVRFTQPPLQVAVGPGRVDLVMGE
jgi:DNA-binding beta-propeller fold protein YncE